MPNWLIALLIGGVLGLILGASVARKSAQQKPIKGGPVAEALHYVASSAFVAVGPTVLVTAILNRELHFFPRLLSGLAMGLSLIAVAAVCLLVFAVFEVQASRGQEQKA
jgi:hypothetical protein